MRRMLSSLALVLALNAGIVAPALAGGDWGYGNGVNPYAAATPVPAPVPVPVYDAQWYFRIDFGAGMGGDPSVSTSGDPFGRGFASVPFGFSPSWLSDNFDAFFTGGGGVGYVWGPHFRTDFTFDVRSIAQVDYIGSEIYDDPGANNRYLTVNDKTEVQSVPLLINGYYDFHFGHALRPYVGAGVGFAVNQLKRDHTSVDYDCGAGTTCRPSSGIETSASETTTGLSFAAAAMAGITWNWSSRTAVDLNYRYMFIGSANADLRINGVNTKINVGDINEHQVRIGLRFNVF